MLAGFPKNVAKEKIRRGCYRLTRDDGFTVDVTRGVGGWWFGRTGRKVKSLAMAEYDMRNGYTSHDQLVHLYREAEALVAELTAAASERASNVHINKEECKPMETVHDRVVVGLVSAALTEDGAVAVITNAAGREVDFDAARALMDNEICAQINDGLAPCDEAEFFRAYCAAHRVKYGEEFEPNRSNPVW